MKYKPWDYQKKAYEWILDHDRCGLFLSMGLGKTVITLSAIKELFKRESIKKVLVIAPLRVASTVWAEEAQKWDHLADLSFSKILGSPKERLVALKKKADVYIINRENVQWLVDYCLKKWPFDMLVIDELSSFKSPRAQRFKSLRRILSDVDRIVGLTGTPAPNGLLDLWSQIYLLDQGVRLGRFVGRYREEYFRPLITNGSIVYKYGLRPGAEDRIYRRISDICMSMTAEDYLDLPDRIDVNKVVSMSVASRKTYDVLERELVIELKGREITAQNAAVLTGKLSQMANGAIYDEEGNYIQIHDAKLEALEDLYEAANGSPVLVFYWYKHDAIRIMDRFPDARLLVTPTDVADWNAGKIPMLLAHPAGAGHGLNLQYGGHIIIWFGLTWSLELYQQANARLHRQGQKHPVTIYHIVTRDTVDEEVLKALSGKAVSQDALINAVKVRVSKY